MDDVALAGDPGGEVPALEAQPVVGDEAQLADLAGGGIGQVLDTAEAEQDRHLGHGAFKERDRVAGRLGQRHGAGEADLGPVANDAAEVPVPWPGRGSRTR